jgi:hypothetical protein
MPIAIGKVEFLNPSVKASQTFIGEGKIYSGQIFNIIKACHKEIRSE